MPYMPSNIDDDDLPHEQGPEDYWGMADVILTTDPLIDWRGDAYEPSDEEDDDFDPDEPEYPMGVWEPAPA